MDMVEAEEDLEAPRPIATATRRLGCSPKDNDSLLSEPTRAAAKPR